MRTGYLIGFALASSLALAACSKQEAAPYAVEEVPLSQISADLGAGKTTSVAVTKAYIARIKTYNGPLHAVIVVAPDALDQAAAADKRRADKKALGPLDGVPILLQATAGTFILADGKVTFTANPDSGITHGGQPVTSIELVSDAKESPTVVSSGPLRFFIIERAGKFAVRVRDVASPRRRDFKGLQYYAIAPEWALEARFDRRESTRRVNR